METDFINFCRAGECRYGLFDFEYMHQCQGTSESTKKQKLFLMSWCPDTAKVRNCQIKTKFLNLTKTYFNFRSRRRCCTQARSTLSRNLLSESRSTFKPQISLKHLANQSKRNCVPLIVSKQLRWSFSPSFCPIPASFSSYAYSHLFIYITHY
jgi:Cofilin/tropomyosin-type actin-binding protein